ncbi:hypothetical protein FA95DRAFT_947551 [Auriscalpium vulgare]|uniref:Uncharacterized protein n=1 Tax=Auriscalpium vulgare TaxID=40419 RepID=A0ACB8RYY0_9AGAM|nr:hypothetical protein FA95DRAFT_947551 [Auriscalpium vulgare]
MKRHRSEEEPPERSSPSGASSPGDGDMADTETDAGPSQPTLSSGGQAKGKEKEESQAAQPPPAKKKRTRTLTTPHQSAVLHALLAQSRFPTTAMREEVGRSIGLSARKVQLIFSQNQRQKARRPRSQSVAPPLTRPPQYGAFSNMPVSAPATSNNPFGAGYSAPPSSYSYPGPPAQYAAVQEHPDPEAALRTPATGTSSSSSGQLSGPGVPGASTPYLPRFPYGVQNPPQLPPPSAYPPSYGHQDPWASHEGSSGSSRPPTEPVPRDFSFNLPPLRLDETRGVGTYSSGGLPRLAPPRNYDISPRPFTADSPFAHHPPLERPSPQSHRPARPLPRLRIPPPLPLQTSHRAGPSYPPPMQERATNSEVGRYLQPVEPVERIASSSQLPPVRTESPVESPQPARPTRFDPVRAAVSEHERSRSHSRDSPTHTPPRPHPYD